MVGTGVLHIISELGGCVVGLPPDKENITASLRKYACRQGMEHLRLLDPSTDDLGEWADMGAFAIMTHRIEGPVLVGTHRGDRVLVGVSKRYGYPVLGAPLHDLFRVEPVS